MVIGHPTSEGIKSKSCHPCSTQKLSLRIDFCFGTSDIGHPTSDFEHPTFLRKDVTFLLNLLRSKETSNCNQLSTYRSGHYPCFPSRISHRNRCPTCKFNHSFTPLSISSIHPYIDISRIAAIDDAISRFLQA